MTHKALVYNRYGNPLKVLELINEDVPKLIEKTDVLVRVHACALNPADLKHCEGELRLLVQRPMPIHLGFDFSGVIEDVGEEAALLGYKKGDDVYGMTKGLRTGTVAEYIVVDASVLSRKPSNLTHVQAASVPLCALTAYQCFIEARLKPFTLDEKGETDAEVVITAGAGGVGTFAIQMAKEMFRVKNVITSGSEQKREILTKLGADEMVNYKEQSLAAYLAKNKKMVDAVLDSNNEVSELLPFVKHNTGGIASIMFPPTQKMLHKWVSGMGKHGAYISGVVSGAVEKLPSVVDLFTGSLWTQHKANRNGVHYGYIITYSNSKDLDAITEYLVAGKITPVIDSIHSLDNWKVAVERLYSGRATGKVIISVYDPSRNENVGASS